MKKIICVILVVVIVSMLCGCGRKVGERFTASERFVIVSGDNLNAPYLSTVIVDKDTGVLYVVFYIGNQCGITPLLNADGSPMTLDGVN